MLTDTSLTLIILAHPDDEFFCSEFVVDEVAEGRAVHCVFLTDGAFNGQSARRRMDETLRGLRRLGVPESHVHFIGVQCGIPDGSLHLNLHGALAALRQAQPAVPGRIYVTAWEGGHQDHDACYVLAMCLASETGCQDVRQFALYNSRQLPGPWFRVMTPLPENGPVTERHVGLSGAFRYLARAGGYPSQWKTWLGLLPFAAWRLVRHRAIAWQSASAMRLAERPHAGTLLYEKRGFVRYEDVRAHIDAFLAGSYSADGSLHRRTPPTGMQA
jgi:N-acetylglucosamine malate deacetylase 1